MTTNDVIEGDLCESTMTCQIRTEAVWVQKLDGQEKKLRINDWI